MRDNDTPTPTGEIHLAAAIFPMLPDDELADLAADIKANGLLLATTRDEIASHRVRSPWGERKAA